MSGLWTLVRHTGDPARVKPMGPSDDWTVFDAEGRAVCWEPCGRNASPETEANARLIAAAPALLEALEGSAVALDEAANVLSDGYAGMARMVRGYADDARAAIASARTDGGVNHGLTITRKGEEG